MLNAPPVSKLDSADGIYANFMSSVKSSTPEEQYS